MGGGCDWPIRVSVAVALPCEWLVRMCGSTTSNFFCPSVSISPVLRTRCCWGYFYVLYFQDLRL